LLLCFAKEKIVTIAVSGGAQQKVEPNMDLLSRIYTSKPKQAKLE
jgi:hypothetical protein